jgi:hypothetical protein
MEVLNMKDINNFEGYAVTEEGQVWSYKSKRFLKPRANKSGYLRVTLYKDGKAQEKYIHRLVAEAYIPNPDNKEQVNHKDEDKSNNNVNNLEWMTCKENNNHGTHNERMGKAHRKPIYCIELDRVFESQAQACKELGINAGQLSGVLRGTTRHKTAGGYHWRYLYK